MKIFNWAYNIFRSLDFSESISSYLNLTINLLILVIVTYLLDYIFKKIFIHIIFKLDPKHSARIMACLQE